MDMIMRVQLHYIEFHMPCASNQRYARNNDIYEQSSKIVIVLVML